MKPYNIHPMCRIVEDTSDPVFKPYFQDVHKWSHPPERMSHGRVKDKRVEVVR